MEGIAASGELIDSPSQLLDARLRFEFASQAHDAAIRRLLRETPMAGRISISMEREPSYFAASAVGAAEHQTIVAMERDEVIAMGSVNTRVRFINRQPMRVGYLGSLRIHPNCRGRTSIIRRGYELLRRWHDRNGAAIYLTSIIRDNLRARRLLERGLPGMPTYRLVGEFVTLVIPSRSAPAGLQSPRLLQVANFSDAADLLNRSNQNHQFAPVWTGGELEDLYSSGLDLRLVLGSEGAPDSCAAIWDQRAFKQYVVRKYAAPLRVMRPFLNLAATVLGATRLPRIGAGLSQAFVSHLASDPNCPEVLDALLGQLLSVANRRQIEHLILGLDARDPRLPFLRKRFKPLEYVSCLYAVHWNDGAGPAQSLDDRLLAPEVALL
jgi:hypothetical protein